MTPDRYPDGLREELRRLWIEHPELSATKIGERLGLNKNQVMGLKSRLVKSGFIDADTARRGPPANFTSEQATWRRQREREAAYQKKLQRAQILAGVQQPALRPPTPRPVFVPPPPPPPPAPAPRPAAAPAEDRPCQYITNSGRPWLFCEAPARSGSSYCKQHHRLCFTYRPSQYERDAA